MIEYKVPLAQMTNDALLDLYEIYCARHGRVQMHETQVDIVTPLRAEIKRRMIGQII